MFRALVRSLTLALTTVTLLGSSVRADDVAMDGLVQLYHHNGSRMKVQWDGQVGEWFEITYLHPRPGLAVKRGTLLVEGSAPASGEISATAYVFRQGCQPAPYQVSGAFDEMGNLFLNGKAPIREGCKVVGYAETVNSWLYFEFERVIE